MVCLKYMPDSKTFTNSNKLVAAFKKNLESDPWLRSWFDPNEGTFLEDNFPGTSHCEAIASVLMHLQHQGLIELLPVCCDFFIASAQPFDKQELENLLGISKRCCPVCAYLIQHLGGIVIWGGQKTVTACSLPLWLPETDMQVMIEEFAKRLRKALDNLLLTELLTESQVQVSTGSICLTVMSFDLDNMEASSWTADLDLENVMVT